MKLRVLEGTSLSHCARASGWTFATTCHVCSTSTGRLAPACAVPLLLQVESVLRTENYLQAKM
jgi:hypothetical protein